MTSMPPPGPGVQPPFAAPPIDGDRTRLWVGLGVGAAALVLCCVGGAVGIGGLVVSGMRAINEQAQATVGGYLDALSNEEYRQAYELLCDAAQEDETVNQFAVRVAREPKVDTYEMDDANTATTPVTLRASVRYQSGEQETLVFVFDQDADTGELEICGVE